jgi:ferric hydroxamate transport system substrate-binding protein
MPAVTFLPIRRLLALCVALCALSLAGPAVADAKPAKRVVALEWEYVENLLAVGVTPIGAADLDGMERWTSVNVPSSIRDVGLRSSPSLERIAELRPDLIIAPRFRIKDNRDELERIAKVLVLDAYPRSGGRDAQYKTMVTGIRKVAKAVGRTSRGDAVLRDLDRTYTKLRSRIRRAGLANEYVTFATAGGTVGSPAARVFAKNSLSAGVLRRLGLRLGWPVASAPFGFTLTAAEGFRRCRIGYLVFAYPELYEAAADEWVAQDAWKALPIVQRKRVRTIDGNSWPYGGPLSVKVLASRIVGALAP